MARGGPTVHSKETVLGVRGRTVLKADSLYLMGRGPTIEKDLMLEEIGAGEEDWMADGRHYSE